MATEEEQRQYEVARQFIELYPQFEANPENSGMLLDWMEDRNMQITLDGLEKAYKAVFLNIEPEVMSPEVFFQKVKPTPAVFVPEVFDPEVFDFDYVKFNEQNQWKPLSTGLTGPTTVGIGQSSAQSTWLNELVVGLGLVGELAPAHVKAAPELPKIIAPMPASWYSEDVVEIKTGRRIKE